MTVDESIVIEAHGIMMHNARLLRMIASSFIELAHLGVNPYYDGIEQYDSMWFAKDFGARADDMERRANKWLEEQLHASNP